MYKVNESKDLVFYEKDESKGVFYISEIRDCYQDKESNLITVVCNGNREHVFEGNLKEFFDNVLG